MPHQGSSSYLDSFMYVAGSGIHQATVSDNCFQLWRAEKGFLTTLKHAITRINNSLFVV
ncbi:hypothetical protein HMPREF0742_01759 [Rothia aeria F0184]|uniref:Uncharacterized protein n=1 Tax=Rothia aeria F0184 TaxID=888019 RepID=U7V1U5_9MICC|nr:hypothetical protein HMPREF0742_01759 [Rothia aeria F0184]